MSSAHKAERPNLRGDRLNILLLLSMYVLQSLPRTLFSAIQLILQNRHVTYAEQAFISLASTTYTLKIIWAPVVDCIYSKRMGRRKSWVIPVQYLICALLLLQSMKVDDWIGSEDGAKRPRILFLTVTFFLVAWLSSIQDIAVDAWALTMLQKRNVGHQGTCNNVGFVMGKMLGYITFTVLSSKDFCNNFRSTPRDYGFVNFSEFMLFWTIVFTILTTLILLYKRDNSLDCVDNDKECRPGVIKSYQRFWQIFAIKPVKKLCFILITCLVLFGPANAVVSLKLMDEGVPRDKFVLASLPTLPALLILPFVLDRHLTQKRALQALLVCFTFRIIFYAVYAVFIYFTAYFKTEDNTFSVVYYVLLFSIYNLDLIAHYGLSIAATAFGSHVSDPRFGAMYATLFNTTMQIGQQWGNTTFIWLKDLLTFTSCSEINDVEVCTVILDGFFVEIIVCMLLGFFWLYFARQLVDQLEKMDVSAFRVPATRDIVAASELLHTDGEPKKQAPSQSAEK